MIPRTVARAATRRRSRRSTRDLYRQLFPQALRFALVLVDRSDVAIRITRRAMRDVLGDRSAATPSPQSAVLETIRRLASEQPSTSRAMSGDERLSHAVTELCDGQGLSHRAAARSLGTTTDEVDRLHALARVSAGDDAASAPRCSGWSLVRRYDDLAAVERAAADRHVELCRECRDAHTARLAARARLRKAIPIGGGGLLAGGVVGGAAALGTAVAGVIAVGVLATGGVPLTSVEPVDAGAGAVRISLEAMPSLELEAVSGGLATAVIVESMAPVPTPTEDAPSTADASVGRRTSAPSTRPESATVTPPAAASSATIGEPAVVDLGAALAVRAPAVEPAPVQSPNERAEPSTTVPRAPAATPTPAVPVPPLPTDAVAPPPSSLPGPKGPGVLAPDDGGGDGSVMPSGADLTDPIVSVVDAVVDPVVDVLVPVLDPAPLPPSPPVADPVLDALPVPVTPPVLDPVLDPVLQSTEPVLDPLPDLLGFVASTLFP